MDLKLNGKRALVTGSTAGIGAAIAAALAREGAQVIVNGRAPADVEKAVRALKTESGGDLVGFAGDLGTAQPIEDLVRRHPEVDILVNNLGIAEPKPFEAITDAEWMRFFEVNVMSGVRLSRAYLPAMKQANWGRIIFISSESALQIPAEMIHYGMTKTAQIAVARGLAETVAGTGITVNSVLPGPTRSRGVNDFVAALGAGGELRSVRDRVLSEVPADLAPQAVRDARRDRLVRRLSREPAVVWDHRRGAEKSTAAWSRAPFEGASAVGLRLGVAAVRPRTLERAELPVDTAELARFLIGKMLVRMLAEGVAGGRIVETEAYSIGDPAGHAYRGMTPRNRALFLERGHAYVYLAYGVSFMLNVSSETPGVGAGVLDSCDRANHRRRDHGAKSRPSASARPDAGAWTAVRSLKD